MIIHSMCHLRKQNEERYILQTQTPIILIVLMRVAVVHLIHTAKPLRRDGTVEIVLLNVVAVSHTHTHGVHIRVNGR